MALLLLFGREQRRGDVDGGGAQLLAKYGVRFNRYVTQSAADDGLK